MKRKIIVTICTALLLCVSGVWLTRTGYLKRGFNFVLTQSIITAIPSGAKYSAYYYPFTPDWLVISVKPSAMQEYKRMNFLYPYFDGNEFFYNDIPKVSDNDSSGKIERVTMTAKNDNNYIVYENIFIANSSSKNIDINNIMAEKLKIKMPETSDSPSILMYHTHITEAFALKGQTDYNASDAPRSKDNAKNIAAVGTALEKAYEGVFDGRNAVIHSIRNHEEVFNKAYTKSLATANEYIKKYPTIDIVLDVHRDSIINKEGVKFAPIVDINGQTAAQVMIIVGSGNKDAPNSHWQDNLRFAVALQRELENRYPNICRPLYINDSRYNSHVKNNAVLLEIGSCGNTQEEAEYTGKLIGETLAEMVEKYR